MKSINYEGEEGYFLSKTQGEQIEKILNHCSEVFEKVIQNADNS